MCARNTCYCTFCQHQTASSCLHTVHYLLIQYLLLEMIYIVFETPHLLFESFNFIYTWNPEQLHIPLYSAVFPSLFSHIFLNTLWTKISKNLLVELCVKILEQYGLYNLYCDETLQKAVFPLQRLWWTNCNLVSDTSAIELHIKK